MHEIVIRMCISIMDVRCGVIDIGRNKKPESQVCDPIDLFALTNAHIFLR